MDLQPSCMFCGSQSLRFEQDVHNKTTKDGALWGVAHCDGCHQLMFWYHKVKSKFQIVGNKIAMSARPTFALVICWDGPLTPWMYDRIAESARLTGRPEHTYYTNFAGDTVRYFQLDPLY